MIVILKLALHSILLGGAVFCALRFGSEFLAVSGGSPTRTTSSMIAWLGGFVGCAVLLALRLSWDLGQFLGNRAENGILQGDPPPVPPPAWSEADEWLRQGEPLKAVNVLRDHLQTHPHELRVHYRIAEIYTDPLRNPLAAALEYEALLGRRLDPERWGWTAIRLARLYRELREFDKADAVLQRVTDEHAQTGAARKAGKLREEWK